MHVTDIETIPLSSDLESGRSFGSSRGRADARETALVRIETDDGVIGWGEAFAPPRTVSTLIDEVFASDIIGMDLFEVESLVGETRTGARGPYHFGGSAFTQCAVSGIDIALWDALGKTVGRPVHQLLGGSRETVTPYASTGYITEWGQDIREPLQEAADEGFTAAKIKIGRGVEDDVERVATAREILGSDANLMVDYNGNYTPTQALRSIEALEPYDLTWVEEPVPPENTSGYKQLQQRLDVPVAAGEAHFSREAFKQLIDERLVDVVQPNIGRVGGFSEGRFVTKLAASENSVVRPHVWNSAVGLTAALQLLAAVPDHPHSLEVPEPVLFEYDRSPNPLREELLTEPLDPTGGELTVPDEPGLGVEVDTAAVERFRIDRV